VVDSPNLPLFDMAQIQESDTFAYINMAFRQWAIELAHRLTSGQAIVIDVYSPQWAANRALARRRRQMPHAIPDPRLDWRAGEISLLPLPNDSVSTAILCQIMGEFWQAGDREVLLKEIFRILKPNGRILVAERARTQINWLVMGPRALSLPTKEQWRQHFSNAGFHLRSEREMAGLIHCFRADKPTPTAGQQLPLLLE
jgi:SAM-dependent methyltransferase